MSRTAARIEAMAREVQGSKREVVQQTKERKQPATREPTAKMESSAIPGEKKEARRPVDDDAQRNTGHDPPRLQRTKAMKMLLSVALDPFGQEERSEGRKGGRSETTVWWYY